MIIDVCRVEKSVVVLALSGRLDTVNAPLLERKIKQVEEDVFELILDFAELEYISSMGLRVLLQAQKTMKEKKKRLVIKNMRESVREVFEMTGFIKLMVDEEKFVVVRKNEPDCIVLFFNGEMKTENVPGVSKELSEIRENKPQAPLRVIIDMEKLTYISPSAVKHLSQAMDDTVWAGRTISIRNACEDVRLTLDIENLGKLINSE